MSKQTLLMGGRWAWCAAIVALMCMSSCSAVNDNSSKSESSTVAAFEPNFAPKKTQPSSSPNTDTETEVEETEIKEFVEPKKTCSEPNVICNVQGLQAISQSLDQDFYLGADIDLAGSNFQQIGGFGLVFEGSLNGQGYQILNLKLGGESRGFFFHLGPDAVVENIEFVAPTLEFLEGATGGGVLAASNAGLVENVHVTDGEVSGGRRVGGLVGANTGSIFSSSFQGIYKPTIQVEEGGLVGWNSSGGLIEDAEVWLDVNVPTRVIEFGGLVGRNSGKIKASDVIIERLIIQSTQNSTEIGGLTARSNGSGAIIANSSVRLSNESSVFSVSGSNSSRIGGLVGLAFSSASIVGSSFKGKLFGGPSAQLADCHLEGRDFGGLVGQIQGASIVDSVVEAEICAFTRVGGIVGTSSGAQALQIQSSVFEGMARAGYQTSSAGGLIGSFSTGGSGSEIRSSYAIGSVMGGSYLGGLVGRMSVGGSLGIFRSFFSGIVTDIQGASSRYSRGGLIGGVSSAPNIIIEESYTEAVISGSSQVGGLIGNAPSSSGSLEVRNSYTSGSVSGDTEVGGLLGRIGCSSMSHLDFVYSNAAVNAPQTTEHRGGLIGRQFGNGPCVGFNAFWNLTRSPSLAGVQDDGNIFGYSKSQDQMLGSSMFTETPQWQPLPSKLPHLKNVVNASDQSSYPL